MCGNDSKRTEITRNFIEQRHRPGCLQGTAVCREELQPLCTLMQGPVQMCLQQIYVHISQSSGGGADREGDTESEAGARLRAVSPEPDAGLEPTNGEIMTCAEVGRSTD